MKKVWLWILPVAAVVGLVVYSDATKPAREAKLKAEQVETQRVAEAAGKAEAERKGIFAAKVLARIPELTKLATVTFGSVIEGKEVTSRVEFPAPVSNYLAAGAARMVTKAVIDTLIEDGHGPWGMFIGTTVQAKTMGVTGMPMVIPYGIAAYTMANDQIVFTPYAD